MFRLLLRLLCLAAFITFAHGVFHGGPTWLMEAAFVVLAATVLLGGLGHGAPGGGFGPGGIAWGPGGDGNGGGEGGGGC